MTAAASRVAIVTRTRNRHFLLARAIRSVLDQSYPDWTHVIVNDGGEAGGLDAFLEGYVEQYAGRLQVVHLPINQGMQMASNAGIQASRSEYLCIHDDDDSWEPTFLEKCVAFLERVGNASSYQGVISQTTAVIEELAEDHTITIKERRPYLPLEEVSLFRLGYENPFPPIAFCYRRSVHDAIGYFDQRYDVCGDLDFNLRFLARYDIGVLPEALANYHWRKDSAQPEYQNTIFKDQSSHTAYFNQLRNALLRGQKDGLSPQLGAALNQARHLVRTEWMVDDVYHRAIRLEHELDALYQSVGAPEAYHEIFSNLREGLAILIAHARDDGLRDKVQAVDRQLEALRNELGVVFSLPQRWEVMPALQKTMQLLVSAEEEQAPALGRLAALFEELCGEAFRDRFSTLREGLAILIDHSRDPGLRDKVQAVDRQLESLRGEMAALLPLPAQVSALQSLPDEIFALRRQESDQALTREKIAALHEELCGEAFRDRFTTLRDGLAILVDHARDPGLRELVQSIDRQVNLLRADVAFWHRLSNTVDDLFRLQQRLTILETLPDEVAKLRGLPEDVARLRGLPEEMTKLVGEEPGKALSRQKITELHGELCGEAFRDRFTTLREGLAILIDHIRDPGLREKVEAIDRQLENVRRETQLLQGVPLAMENLSGLPARTAELTAQIEQQSVRLASLEAQARGKVLFSIGPFKLVKESPQ